MTIILSFQIPAIMKSQSINLVNFNCENLSEIKYFMYQLMVDRLRERILLASVIFSNFCLDIYFRARKVQPKGEGVD